MIERISVPETTLVANIQMLFPVWNHIVDSIVAELDIFRVQVRGGVRWIGSAENLEAAKVLIKADATKRPGDFLVVNLQSGEKTEIKGPAA
jgi:hypothetical protein